MLTALCCAAQDLHALCSLDAVVTVFTLRAVCAPSTQRSGFRSSCCRDAEGVIVARQLTRQRDNSCFPVHQWEGGAASSRELLGCGATGKELLLGGEPAAASREARSIVPNYRQSPNLRQWDRTLRTSLIITTQVLEDKDPAVSLSLFLVARGSDPARQLILSAQAATPKVFTQVRTPAQGNTAQRHNGKAPEHRARKNISRNEDGAGGVSWSSCVTSPPDNHLEKCKRRKAGI
ncbi:hypothetical protein NDU88_005206 [Pleurodeles waltl]|uniref:Uncharacterized protein n=1 Tax=Pleurodeles waltl TaxID=8319 RepID=A0AAV7MW23_PLEWA|nr:hypothetical protein NDU88_005206 [Pleurodeles waltl]